MPIKFGAGEKVKSTIDTYEIELVLSQGAFAHAAKAGSAALGGKPVFIKRYFSPTRALGWYNDFVEHQQELKRRINSNDGLRLYCYKFLDFFEGTEGRSNKTFHQVFEFVDSGKSLALFLQELEAEGVTARWAQRVTFARVMMMGIAALHEQRIVHTDLKPENLLLIPIPERADNYHLKVIDLDWAIFSDRQAPWHGQGVGYVGTPGYMSPEHLLQKVPTECSDVFTCALMLSELLGCGHPFKGKLGDDTALAKAVTAGDFKRFALSFPIEKVKNPSHLEELINRALDPIATNRPTASELKNALFGRGLAGDTKAELPPMPAATPVKRSSPPDSTAPDRPIELRHEGKVALKIGIDTTVGRMMLKSVSADAQFLAEAQFKIYRSAEKSWLVSPISGTQNETLLDGKLLAAPLPLHEGMRISVGNSAKGIEKLPLIVHML